MSASASRLTKGEVGHHLQQLKSWLESVLRIVENRKVVYLDIFGCKTKVDNTVIEADAIKAFERGHTKLLLESQVVFKKNFASLNWSIKSLGYKLLDEVIKANFYRLLDAMGRYGVNMNMQSIEEDAPLLTACRLKNLITIEILLRYGANVNMVGKVGQTPLLALMRNPNHNCERGLSCLKLLLSNGADPNASSISPYYFTPLYFALDFKLIKYAYLLMRYGADPMHFARRMSLFNLAVSRDFREAVILMLLSGIEPDRPDGRGRSAFGVARYTLKVKILTLLVGFKQFRENLASWFGVSYANFSRVNSRLIMEYMHMAESRGALGAQVGSILWKLHHMLSQAEGVCSKKVLTKPGLDPVLGESVCSFLNFFDRCELSAVGKCAV